LCVCVCVQSAFVTAFRRTKQKGFIGTPFVRPEQTYHVPTRRFYVNEVFRTRAAYDYSFEDVTGSCCVLYIRDYVKGTAILEFDLILWSLHSLIQATPKALKKRTSTCASRVTTTRTSRKISRPSKTGSRCCPRRNRQRRFTTRPLSVSRGRMSTRPFPLFFSDSMLLPKSVFPCAQNKNLTT